MRWLAGVLVAGSLAGCSCGVSTISDAGGADGPTSPRRFVALTVLYRSACALRADGEAVCWGEGWAGHTVLAGSFTMIASGAYDRACGLDRDGAVVCVASDLGPAVQEPPPGTFIALAVADGACALDRDGAAHCWGYGRPSPGMPVYPPPTTEPLVQISIDAWACATTQSGAGVCWHPFLPDDGTPTGAPAGIAAPPGSFIQVQRVGTGSCGLRTDGEVECWSYSDAWLAEMGDPPAGPFVELASGSGPICALRPTGEAVCWGTAWPPNAETGWAGIARYQPAERYTAIGAGSTFVCGIRLDGTISCWGYDEWGITAPPTVE